MRHLGIDFGTKKVGIALSDEAGTMGFPKEIMQNTPKLAQDVAAYIAAEGVEKVVIGESRDFAGNENPVAADAKEFAKELAELSGVPIAWEPEMMTTQEARRAHAKDPDSRAPQSREHVDATAAALILTAYLSRKN